MMDAVLGAAAIVAAVTAVIALRYSATSAASAAKAANASEDAVEVSKKAAEAATRSAEAAERANLIMNQGLDMQRAASVREEAEWQRRYRTTLVVEGWSGRGGLLVTNTGPGAARDVLVVLTSPRRYVICPGLRPGHQELVRLRETNGWPEDFAPQSEPPDREKNPDVVFLRWKNEDGSIADTGWVPAPEVP